MTQRQLPARGLSLSRPLAVALFGGSARRVGVHLGDLTGDAAGQLGPLTLAIHTQGLGNLVGR